MAKTRPTLAEACRMYPHRYTMEHIPEWAKKPCINTITGEVSFYYAPQFRTDKEWYENTLFPGEMGEEGHELYCYTLTATWPLGHTLPEPYVKGE